MEGSLLYDSYRVKIWIAKNSEVPVREQLIAQITLGIASGDLKLGDRLPTTREIALRNGVHANTVAAAYQKLVDQKLIEFRTGSGFYVAENATERIEGSRKFEDLVADFLTAAKELGFEPKDVIDHLKKLRPAAPPDGVLIVESDPGLREILLFELQSAGFETSGVTFEDFSENSTRPQTALITAMFDEEPKIAPILQNGQKCVYLKGNSVASAMSGETRPGADQIVAVVSGWDGFLTFARIMLLAAKIDPAAIVVRSTNDEGWMNSVKRAAVVVCDSYTASRMDGLPSIRPFRVVADHSIAELSAELTRVKPV